MKNIDTFCKENMPGRRESVKKAWFVVGVNRGLTVLSLPDLRPPDDNSIYSTAVTHCEFD